MGRYLGFEDDVEDRRIFDQLAADLHGHPDTAFVFLGAGFSNAAVKHLASNRRKPRQRGRGHDDQLPNSQSSDNRRGGDQWRMDSGSPRDDWYDKFPLWVQLIERMAKQIASSNQQQKKEFLQSHESIDVAQFLKASNIGQYNRVLRDALWIAEEEFPDELPPTHDNLLDLGLRTIVTSNCDQLIEFCYNKKFGHRPQLAFKASQINDLDRSDQKTSVIKMHGCVSEPDTMVFAREDYARAWHEREALFSYIKEKLQTTTCLFLGYGLRDANFNYIYDEIRYYSGFKTGKLNYAIVAASSIPINDVTRQYWASRNIQLIAIRSWHSLSDLLAELADRLGRTSRCEG